MNKGPGTASSDTPAAAGIVFMCLGCFSMVGLDVSVRFLLEDYPLLQVVLLRCCFSALFILLYTIGRGELHKLRTRRPGWHALRSLLMAASVLSFFYALSYLPLAEIIIFAFAAPLIVTAVKQSASATLPRSQTRNTVAPLQAIEYTTNGAHQGSGGPNPFSFDWAANAGTESSGGSRIGLGSVAR
jgi:hypothetical protein